MVISHCTALSIIELNITLFYDHFLKYEVSWFDNNIGIYIYICIYMCICICLCIYMYIYICVWCAYTKQPIDCFGNKYVILPNGELDYAMMQREPQASKLIIARFDTVPWYAKTCNRAEFDIYHIHSYINSISISEYTCICSLCCIKCLGIRWCTHQVCVHVFIFPIWVLIKSCLRSCPCYCIRGATPPLIYMTIF